MFKYLSVNFEKPIESSISFLSVEIVFQSQLFSKEELIKMQIKLKWKVGKHSLAMSTSVLKALPGKLDIKRHSFSLQVGSLLKPAIMM